MFLIFNLVRFRRFFKAGYKFQLQLMKECFQTFFLTHDNLRKSLKILFRGWLLAVISSYFLLGLFFDWITHNNIVRKK